MDNAYYKTLELDKIRNRAAGFTVCKEAAARLLAQQPWTDPDEVRFALSQTDAINSLLLKNGSPPLWRGRRRRQGRTACGQRRLAFYG